MTNHKLKTWPQFFRLVRDGRKTFEVRRNDRGFQIGDTLTLAEWSNERQEYTGRELTRRIVYVFDGAQWPEFGIAVGFVVLGIK